MHRSVPHLDFWTRFVAQTDLPDANNRFFETMRLGDTDETADEAAALVLSGAKMANCSLKPSDTAAGAALPRSGALSILEDGSGNPVAVLETVEVFVERFAEIDDAFARAYGEWGGSLKSWRRQCRAHFGPRCRDMGRPFGEDTEIVCERFRVVFIPPRDATVGGVTPPR